MSSLLQHLLGYVLMYTYAAIFLLNLLASIALPFPGSTIIIASSFFASQGYLNLLFVFLTGLSSSILGDNVLYWISRKYGKSFFSHIGLRRLMESKTLKNLESKFAARPFTMIILTRFGGNMTPIATFLAGQSSIKFKTFLIADVIGELFTNTVLCIIGYAFADDWDRVLQMFERFYVLITLIFFVLLFFLIQRRSRNKNPHP